MKMTFQEIRIIATGPCIANQLRDVNTICRRSWYIAAHVWKINDFKIEVVPLIINFSTELTNLQPFLITGRLQVRYVDAFDTISRLVKDATGYGGRSISLWQTQTMALTYDTGFELEHQENTNYPATFNGEVSNVNQSPTQQRDLRSDDHVSL